MTEEPVTTPPVAHRRLFIASMVALLVFAGAVTTPAICLRQMGEVFGMDLGDRGFVAAVRVAMVLFGVLLTGYLADRMGKGPFLVAGLTLLAAGLALTTFAGSFGALLMTQAVMGLGAGAMEAQVNPLVAELHPKNPARALNVVNGLFSIGVVASALMSGEILEAGGGWRACFWVWVLPALVGASLFATRRYPRAAIENHAPDGQGFLKMPLFWLLAVAMVCGGGCEAGLTYWGPNFTEAEFGATARAGAWSTVMFGGFMAAGRFASGGLVSRISPIMLLMVSAVGCVGATLGLSFVSSVQGVWALFGLGGLFIACSWPTILAIASAHIGNSTTMFAVLAAFGIGGCTIFPWAIGAIGDLAGLRVGVVILPISMAIQAVVLVAVWRMGAGCGSPSTESCD
ncbi:MAG TPA: MFS transporter [Armatimonadota bacterium]|nr:MFS transporter [Armatimonadota bacterium]